MNANEIIKALRCFSNCDDTKCHDCAACEKYCEDHVWKDDYYEIAADCIEKLVAMHEECGKNYQQKCRDILKLETELAITTESLEYAEEYLQSATDDMEDIVYGKDYCKKCTYYEKCEEGNTTTCGQFCWADSRYRDNDI